MHVTTARRSVNKDATTTRSTIQGCYAALFRTTRSDTPYFKVTALVTQSCRRLAVFCQRKARFVFSAIDFVPHLQYRYLLNPGSIELIDQPVSFERLSVWTSVCLSVCPSVCHTAPAELLDEELSVSHVLSIISLYQFFANQSRTLSIIPLKLGQKEKDWTVNSTLNTSNGICR